MKLKELFENDDDDTSYYKWKKLVNLSSNELSKFIDSKLGKEAGLSRSDVQNTSLSRGRDSARAIIRMREKPFSQWTSLDIEWMNKQISFISRMSGGNGPLLKDGIPSRRLMSLWIWGNSPNGLLPSNYKID